MEIAKVQTTSVYRKIVIGFSILAVLILGLIAYFAFSKTIITITLNPRSTSTTMTVAIKKNLTDEEKSQQTALAGYLVSTAVEGTKTFINEARGGEQVPAQATGHVTIHNNWTQDQPLAATTRLLTADGILFRIKNRVDVPAGGTIENVEVYADQPGVGGNIAAATFTIPGLWPGLQEKIYAESTEAMTGGLRAGNVLTQKQINEAKKTLTGELVAKAVAELSQTDEVKNNNDAISEEAVSAISISETASAKDGDEVSSFDLTLKIKVIAVVFDQTDVAARAATQLRQEISNDEQIASGGQTTISYNVLEYDEGQQTATLEVMYSGTVVPRLSNSIFYR